MYTYKKIYTHSNPTTTLILPRGFTVRIICTQKLFLVYTVNGTKLKCVL